LREERDMKEILPGVWCWSVFNQERGMSFNGHFIANDEGRALIDPPPMSQADLAQLAALGAPEAIIVTNRHHSRDAMTFAGRYRARILLNEADAREIPPEVRLGGVYRDGDTLPGGLTVIALQDQKSAGESALLLRKADAVILGDALIGEPAGTFRLLPAEKYADAGKAREGIRRLLGYPFDAVLVGDGSSILRGGRKAVEEFLARRAVTKEDP
jgi:glyoxylase-like metal-dependent hydrolase (beta-lactamase superfamily II)